MPVCLNLTHPSRDHHAAGKWPCTTPEFEDGPRGWLEIGLVNNMPDTALEATEQQFLSLLDAASDGIPVRLSLYALPGVVRKEAGRRYIKKYYSSAEALWGQRLDGLIVTGAEPLAASLTDEPYWEDFTRLLEWARENTYSTVWSCLAAHAAILQMDGVGRRKSPAKHSGILECEHLTDHWLTAGVPANFRVPHSRWNGISDDDLAASGYAMLTRSVDAGVDAFVKEQENVFVYFQGHPEYESDTLLREYRRDVGRYLRGESETYPSMPKNYFDDEAAAALNHFQEKSMLHRSEALLAELSTILRNIKITNTWQSAASRMYRNWLEYITARKSSDLRPAAVEARAEVAELGPVSL
jgi:homoserine O-succinyltransferase/O-acetyltransferase